MAYAQTQAVADAANGAEFHQDLPALSSQDNQTVIATRATGNAEDTDALGEGALPAIPCESASVATAIPEMESISGDTVNAPQTEQTSSDVVSGSSTLEQQASALQPHHEQQCKLFLGPCTSVLGRFAHI